MGHLKWTYLAAGAAAVCCMASAPAQAQLVADGITYTLTEMVVSPTMDDFTLSITGINGTADTEMGRSGVQSFAFNDEGSGWSITAPAGFTLMSGGLNASGCDGSGSKFFCFSANTTPPKTPALAANSSLSFNFAISGGASLTRAARTGPRRSRLGSSPESQAAGLKRRVAGRSG